MLDNADRDGGRTEYRRQGPQLSLVEMQLDIRHIFLVYKTGYILEAQMRYFISIALAMLFAFGGLAQADEPNGQLKEDQLYSLQLTYRVDGKVVATPNITVRSGQKAEIESLKGYPYKIDLLLGPAAVSSAKPKIAVSLDIYSRDGFAANENKWKKIASPVIIKALDDRRFSHSADVSGQFVRSMANAKKYLQTVEVEAVVTEAGDIVGHGKKCGGAETFGGDAPGDDPAPCCTDGCLRCCGDQTCCSDGHNCPGGGCCTG